MTRWRAVDNAGNSSSGWYPGTLTAGATARIVRTAPSVLITSAPNNPTTSTTANFTWTISGYDIGSPECRLDGAGWGPCDSQNAQSYTGLGAGGTFHEFEVRGTNAAGTTVANWIWAIND